MQVEQKGLFEVERLDEGLVFEVPGVPGSATAPRPIRIASSGVTVLVGPNGAGKTRALRAIQTGLQSIVRPLDRHVRFMAAGRSAPFERFRSAWDSPSLTGQERSYVGHVGYRPQWHMIESITGDFLELEQRADLRLKVQARLQAFLSRSIKMVWSQEGLEISIAPLTGGRAYTAGAEASGILQLVPLMAAIYNDRIGALLIDEPEISLHPQYQAFIRDELSAVAGDPRTQLGKKFVVIATHAPAMLSMKRAQDLARYVFFSVANERLHQLGEDAPELQNRGISAFITRLSATHRLAFFARNVLLVEGPSDEIIVDQLAAALHHPLLAANVQIVPVNGKGEFLAAVRLFELLGKRVTVLADLDALSDSYALISHFGAKPEAITAAELLGHTNIAALDRSLRSDFARAVPASWEAIQTVVTRQAYWKDCPEERRDEVVKRRATLAALLSGGAAELDNLAPDAGFASLLSRYNALLGLLAEAGCFFLRRGAIEAYFTQHDLSSAKPDAAAIVAAEFINAPRSNLESKYPEPIAALRYAGKAAAIDENMMLRERLGALLGAAFQTIEQSTSHETLNARAHSILGDDAALFALENISDESRRAIRVSLRTPLFARETFPFDISATDNANLLLNKLLPSHGN